MPLRLYTNSSGFGTQLRGGVLGRYGSQAAPRSPWALFFGAPGVQSAPAGTYQTPGPAAEGLARATMGRAVGSIVGATQDGSRLIVRGVDGNWYITDNQGVPIQQTTAQAAQQLVTSGQFNPWAGTVMPDGNIKWANMSPADANLMALAQGAPAGANGATATEPTTTGGPAAPKGGDLTATGAPAGMKFVGIAADGKTLIFVDSEGATYLYSRDPATMQLTPITGLPAGTSTSAPSATIPPAGTPEPGVTPPAPPADATATPPGSPDAGSASAPSQPAAPGETLSGTPLSGTPPPSTAPEVPASSSGPPTGGGVPPGFPASPGGATAPQTLMDVLNASPDQFNLTPDQVAALTSTMVDSSMFAPPDLATPAGDVPPPPVTGGGGGAVWAT